MMQSSDAMVILVRAFNLDGVLADSEGYLAHLFTGDFEFAATELDGTTIRLSAQLSGLPTGRPDIARRLLEANLAGVETGAAALAPDPVGGGLFALVDHVDMSGMDADAFRLRFVDFMLYVEYWRAEGVAAVLREARREAAARETVPDAVMVRA